MKGREKRRKSRKEADAINEGEFRVGLGFSRVLARNFGGFFWRKEGDGADLVDSDEQGNLIPFAWGADTWCLLSSRFMHLSVLGTLMGPKQSYC